MSHTPSRFSTLHVLLLAAGLLAPLPARAQAPQAEWTVMSYFDADCDLERAMVRNLRQAIEVGSTGRVNIIFLADRAAPLEADERECFSNEGVGGLEDWTGAKLIRAEKGAFRELDDWGLVDLGDPAVLERFVRKVTHDFPARKYALIFSDHGASWPGVCFDSSADDNQLTLPEIRGVLEATRAAYGGKLEVIGFDACLMATAEVAVEVAPYARYLLASEELEPAEGWDYLASLGKLVAKPAMDGAELGKLICDDYQAQFDGSEHANVKRRGLGITLSLVALDKVAPLEAALDVLARETRRRSGSEAGWQELARARSRTEGYGGRNEDEPGAQVFDLVRAASLLAARSKDEPLQKAAAAASQAIGDAVVHNVHGGARPHASGLSVFWPREAAMFSRFGDSAKYETLALSRTRSWFPFLQSYVGINAADTAAPEMEDVKASADVVKAGHPIDLTCRSGARDIADATFALAVLQGDTRVLLGSIPTTLEDDGGLSEKWPGDWFHVRAGSQRVLCPISGFEEVDPAEGRFFVTVPAQAKRAGRGTWFDVTLYFYLDMDPGKVSGQLVYAYARTDDGQREIPLAKGDQVRPVFLQLTAEGATKRQALEGRQAPLTLDADGALSVELAPVARGEYLVGFLVTDLAGNVQSSFVPVKLQ